jgi:hypothetical protein
MASDRAATPHTDYLNDITGRWPATEADYLTAVARAGAGQFVVLDHNTAEYLVMPPAAAQQYLAHHDAEVRPARPAAAAAREMLIGYPGIYTDTDTVTEFGLTGARAWVAGQPAGQFTSSEEIAGLIGEAVLAGVITGGPPGAQLLADCTCDSNGAPDGWRVLLRVPGLGCLLAAETEQSLVDVPGVLDLLNILTAAVDAANELLAIWAAATGAAR